MANKNKERLAKLGAALKHEGDDEAPPSPKGGRPLLQRDTTLSKVASGSQRTVKLLMHPPSRIRMWENHNRDYELLSTERCADLIEGFTRTGKQEFPAVARKVSDDSKYDYEIICGARRHWTASHLDWDLLIEVRDLSDRQAFILQDLENRDREDISDYERAIDYLNALPKFFESNRAQMANFLEIDKANFHRLLELADLPKSIVNAYSDIRDLKVHHGTAYKKLLADNNTKRRLTDAAKKAKEEGVQSKKVFAYLKQAALKKETQSPAVLTCGNLSARLSGDRAKIEMTLPSSGQLTKTDKSKLAANFEELLESISQTSP